MTDIRMSRAIFERLFPVDGPAALERFIAMNDGREKGRISPDAPAPKTKQAAATTNSPEPTPPVNRLQLMQIAVAVGSGPDDDYGVFALDVCGRVWRLVDGVWLFGGGPLASDLPPGW